ncbi:family 69 glycosyltransferase [Fusarium redolens]|uniref:Family 69 glycosyltransferase n=1 Tax=Fusarium redolens TaxID=48865 RepID=A0A9P9G7H6_FUSRE|nr:family 69 glycosyltransferase [Fusarium redolens]KAH7233811.1 family 69 glycosyltransferase [Fusarium redolens]
MPGKPQLLAIPLFALAIIAWTLYSQKHHFATYYTVQLGQRLHDELHRENSRIAMSDGDILPAANISAYLKAIFYRQSAGLPSFQCPRINATRYNSLVKSSGPSNPTIRYYLALDLRENLILLPRLIGSVVEAIQFLGPRHCMLSIVEGNSPDGTGDVLSALGSQLETLGITYVFQSSPIDPTKTERISSLAALRNLALQPLFEHRDQVTKDTTIIFSNDVTACPDDILELVYQRKSLRADMTCAMDWNLENPRFYDVWISRAMNGDSFLDVPNGDWGNTSELFWNAKETRARFDAKRPFQVFSCWNGAAVFGAQPIIESLRFRAAKKDECPQGEPQLFCKDMWYRGYGKIAVVPSVNLEYKLERGRKLKEKMGFTSDIVSEQDLDGDCIKWKPDPPAKVKCIAEWNDQYWVPWNESLP